MRILGIDPGTAILGWGVIDHTKDGNLLLVNYGALLTKAHTPMPERLEILFQGLNKLFEEYEPDECTVEQLFFNSNVTTAISVGQARGVVLLSSQLHQVPVHEYTPLQVKSALSGYGRAYKGQIQSLVKIMLSMKEIPKPDDAADALAIAIVHTQYAKPYLK